MRFVTVLSLVGSLLAVSSWTTSVEATVTFRNTTTLSLSAAAGPGVQAIAVADVNNDGKPDIIVAQPSVGSVSVFLNNGTGGFTTPHVELGSNHATVAVTTGDFNHDGKVDLAVVNQNVASVTVYLGDGTGNFTNPRDFSVGSNPVGVVSARLDSDLFDDLAVLSDRSVYLLKSNGDGTFSPFNPTSPSVSTNSTGGFAIAAGRINNSHDYIDLAVSNANGNSVTVLFGNNDGTFKPPSSSPRPISGLTFPQGLVIGEFDDDTKPDIAVITGTDVDTDVKLLFGNGDGTFSAPQTTASSQTSALAGSVAIAAADFDLDGKTDFIIGSVGVSPAGGVQLFCHQPSAVCLDNGTRPNPIVPPDVGFQIQSTLLSGSFSAVQTTDINGDRKPDFVAVQENGSVVVLLNTTGQPTTPTPDTPTSTPAVSFTPTPTVLTATPTVTSTPVPTSTPTPIPTAPYSVCNTNDPGQPTVGGKPVAVAVVGDFYHDANAIAVADNQGNRVVLLHPHINSQGLGACGVLGMTAGNVLSGIEAPVALAAADFDHDGKLDLAVVGSAGLSVFFGDGKGGFPVSTGPMAAGTNPQALAVADFNRDGWPDIIVADQGSNNVSIFFGAGQRSFQSPCAVSVGRKTSLVTARDLDGDGLPDFAVASQQTNDIVVFLQVSATPTSSTCPVTFTNRNPISLLQQPQALVSDSFGSNGSIVGFAAALAPSGSTGAVQVFLGSPGLAGTGSRLSMPVPAGSTTLARPSAVGTGDINGDGLPDLIVADANNNDVVIFLGRSDGSFPQNLNLIPFLIEGRQPVGIAIADIDGDGVPDIVTANQGDGSVSILVSSRPPPTPTPLPTGTPTATGTPTPSFTPTSTGTTTATPTPTPTGTGTPVPTFTPFSTAVPSATLKPGTIGLQGSCAIDPSGQSGDWTWAVLSIIVVSGVQWRRRSVRRPVSKR